MRALITLPLLVLLVLFTLSNRQAVDLGLWPTDFAWHVPLSIALLVFAALAFLAGTLFSWGRTLAARRRARRAEETVRLLEARVEDLRQRLPLGQLPPQ